MSTSHAARVSRSLGRSDSAVECTVRPRRVRSPRHREEAGFTLIELMVSVMILGSIVGVIGMVFTVSLQSTAKVRDMLPGPRAANGVALYLASDVSSAVPVDPDAWLSTDPKVPDGCAGGGADAGINVLRIESRSAVDMELTYVASYRLLPPVVGEGTSTLWRTFCRSGSAPSSRSKVADGIDPADPPIVTVAEGNRSVEVLFRVWTKRASPARVAACRALAPSAPPSPQCPFVVKVRAAVRTMEQAPTPMPGTAPTVSSREPCQFVAAKVGTPTRVGDFPGPLEGPVSVVVTTNESNGARCREVLVKVPAVAGAECALAREGGDVWAGSCFGPETGTIWPITPPTFPAFVFDRAHAGPPKPDPTDPPIDIEVPGADLTLSVQTLLAPGPPTGLAVKSKDRSLQLSWLPPNTPDIPPITSYIVTAMPGSATCSTGTTSCALTGLVNGTTYTVTVKAANRVGVGRGASITGRPWPPLSISGTVFEDVNYGGGSGRPKDTALAEGGTGRGGVRVELFNVTGATATYLDATSTDGSGKYSFPAPTCASCAVRVVTSTVMSGRKGSTGSLRPVLTMMMSQTGTSSALRSDIVGGTDPAAVDGDGAAPGASFSTATGLFSDGSMAKAQAFATIDDTVADASGFDFGFNFATVTNTNDAGAGSLRQVVTNASAFVDDAALAVRGRAPAKEHVVFMIPNGTPGSGGSLNLVGGLREEFTSFVSEGGAEQATIALVAGNITVSSPMVIDAQTQPGWTDSPIVKLTASGVGGDGGDGAVTISGAGAMLRGLIITGSARHGVEIVSNANTVQENLITANRGSGVVVSGPNNGNAILGNIITANGGLGIDLRGDGVTENDGFTTAGQANLLNDQPVFTLATLIDDKLTVSGHIGASPNQIAFAKQRVEVFEAATDPSGFGEAASLLGVLTSDSKGNFLGTLRIPAEIVLAKNTSKLTATATDTSNNTSEFSANFTVDSNGYGPSMWVDASDIDGDGVASNEPEAGSEVLQLTDKSGNARHFTSAAGNLPTVITSSRFSKNVLRFTPSQWMRQKETFKAPTTVIYVARSRSTSSGRILQGIGNNWLLGWWGGREQVAYADGWVHSSPRVPDLRAHVMSMVIRGVGEPTDFVVDGAPVGSNTGGVAGPVGLAVNTGLASGETTDAEVAEILVFPRALTADERTVIELGLMDKWGTAANNLVATSPVRQVAKVGQPVPSDPQVVVRRQLGGSPVSGVSVTFTANARATVGGQPSVTVVTDSSGVATAPAWVIEAEGCTNRLTASSPASVDVVRFSAVTGACSDSYGVPGVSMWVDVADTDGDGDASNEPAMNSSVRALLDKSGFANDFESAEGREPTIVGSKAFSKNVLRFSPLQWMKQNADFPAPSTVVYVARSRTSSNGRILQGVANNWLLGWWANREGVAYAEGWVRYPGVAGTQSAAVMTAVIPGAGEATEIAKDGVVVASSNAGRSGPNGLAINTGLVGGGETTDAEFAELLVFPRALMEKERLTIEAALAEKWGLDANITLAANTPLMQTGSNGAAAISPKVRATGFAALPVAGVSVNFAASAGGTVGGSSAATVLTDTDGIATAPSWVPNSTACFDRLTATSAGAVERLRFGVQKGACPIPFGVSGPSMWVDASDTDADGATGNEPAPNSPVVALTDKSGNARDFESALGSQPTLVSSAAFPKSVLRFTPAQWMKQTDNFGSPSTVIYVARTRTTTAQRVLQAVSNNWLLGWWGGQEEVAYMDGWVQQRGLTPTTRARIMSATSRGTSTEFAVDGVVRSSTASGITGPYGLAINTGSVAGGETSDAEVAEIIVFPRALTTGERLAVESGLASKWGVELEQTLSATTTGTPAGVPGGVVAVPPQVRVALADGTKIADASVTFTVVRGDGTVGGAASAAVVTDRDGLATAPAWLLSSADGYQQLTATTPKVRRAVVFTADTGNCPAFGVCAVPDMWVDASDIDGDGDASNQPALGSAVPILTDRSGNNRPFSSESGREPTLLASTEFAKPVLGFTTSQWMRQPYDFGGPTTVIYVARARAEVSGRILSGIGNNWLLGWHGNLERVAYFSGWVAHPGPTRSNAGRVMSAVIRSGSENSDVYTDGALQASNSLGTSGPNGLTINNHGENTDAELAELIVFPRALTNAERVKVETGLAVKWGLSSPNPPTAGLVASLDADATSSMFTDSTGTSPVTAAGQLVCRWADLSAASNHGVQSMPAKCPTYGTDATGGFVNFTANGFLRTTPVLSPDATVLVVAQSTTPTWNTWGWLAAGRGPNGFIIHPWRGDTTIGFYPVNSAGAYTLVGQLRHAAITRPTLYELILAGTNPVTGRFGINGVTTPYQANGVVRTAGAVPVVLGSDDYGTRYGDGKYREVLIYDRALTAAELRQAESYLRWKWATG